MTTTNNTATLTTAQVRARARALSRRAPAKLHELATAVLASQHWTSAYDAFVAAFAAWQAR